MASEKQAQIFSDKINDMHHMPGPDYSGSVLKSNE